MKHLIFGFALLLFSCSEEKNANYNELTQEEKYILLEKGTEERFSGIYNDHFEVGTYHCKQCDTPLFKSDHKFDSKSGWPSFDDFLAGSVKVKNPQAVYTEITCSECDGHLGHVKSGEKLTPKNKRYCVNSLALKFKSKN